VIAILFSYVLIVGGGRYICPCSFEWIKIGKDMRTSCCALIWGFILAFLRMDWEKWGQIIVLCISILTFVTSRQEGKYSELSGSKHLSNSYMKEICVSATCTYLDPPEFSNDLMAVLVWSPFRLRDMNVHSTLSSLRLSRRLSMLMSILEF
jgi:hypothetical protein